MYKYINYSKLNTFIQDLNINFQLSLQNSDDNALKSLLSYDIFDNRNRKKRPNVGTILDALLFLNFKIFILLYHLYFP